MRIQTTSLIGRVTLLIPAIFLTLACSGWEETSCGEFNLITQKDGPTLSYSPSSGVTILTVKDKAFKDLDRDGRLTPYEDWRLSPQERARDLAGRLSVEELCGLLICSNHQAVPSEGRGVMAPEVELTDAQKELLRKPTFVRALRNFFQAAWNGEPYPERIDMSELTPEEKAWLSDEKTITAFVAYMMERTGSVQSYNGTTFKLSGASPWDMTDQQKEFMGKDQIRGILVTSVESPEVAARWNNTLQAYVEGIGHGIPVGIHSDPRHQAASDLEYYRGSGGVISRWPSSLGLAASFDPVLVERHGQIASIEYRALGITTALSPQVDIATEPRWWRFDGTFGEDPSLSADMARAYCDGFQTSPEGKRVSGAWGYESVNAMAKHWYGYGAQEGGRDSHFANGKYAVFPGNNLREHLKPFVEGAFKLKRGTGSVSAVMPTYSILWNQDPSGENVGGAFSEWCIRKTLREEAGFEGVVCTDWGITLDNTAVDYTGGGEPWGVEQLSVAQRHYKIFRADVDQIGGTNSAAPLREAYAMWEQDFGKEAARERFETSARRLLLNMFRTGLFENPYLDPEETVRIVGNPEFMQEGYEAQMKALVMLKNSGNAALPQPGRKKVWFPKKHFPSIPGLWGGQSEDYTDYPIKPGLVEKYFDLASSPAEADFALVVINGPAISVGWDAADIKRGGNGYIPVSLQYEPYTATNARAESIAGGHHTESFTNRSYKGKTVTTRNRDDMLLVRETKKAMGNKPVVVVICLDKPAVMREFEPYADAILVSFGVQHQAILDIVNGKAEPSGLLPMQMPADMETVETQKEDVPRDMRCHRDTDGNLYDFAFGMNWSGVIRDERVEKYSAQPLRPS